MKKFAVALFAGLLSLAPIAGGTAFADPYHRGEHWRDRDDDRDHRRGDWRRDRHERGYDRGYRDRGYDRGYERGDDRGYHRSWRRGDRLPAEYRHRYRQVDWRRHHYRAPPHGYHYVRDDRGETLLVGIATGVVLGVILSQ